MSCDADTLATFVGTLCALDRVDWIGNGREPVELIRQIPTPLLLRYIGPGEPKLVSLFSITSDSGAVPSNYLQRATFDGALDSYRLGISGVFCLTDGKFDVDAVSLPVTISNYDIMTDEDTLHCHVPCLSAACLVASREMRPTLDVPQGP